MSRFNWGGVAHGKLSKNSNNRTFSRTLELPLPAKSSVFSFLFAPESRLPGVSFAPFPEEEILDYLTQGPIPFLVPAEVEGAKAMTTVCGPKCSRTG